MIKLQCHSHKIYEVTDEMMDSEILMSQILVIDDSEFDRRMITRAMKHADKNLTFFELARGENVIDTMRLVKPDVVLLDIRMPGIGGFEVLDRIKDDSSLGDCKIIMISGSCAETDKVKSKAGGAAAYYTKPNTKFAYETMAQEIHGLYLSTAA